ncbi:hypothetical protein CAEBREN_07996 [Caenorhabditis brenneri]|uniref:Uncharacterized protein n=1 Tax=Caenorhabditis brenneri TaxID=135651 RepID=G0N4K0_CAEBE|nr:hypothetical protein CAEBREN_07996 [Caenorhabditis brenneri]
MTPRHQTCSPTSSSRAPVAKYKQKNLSDVEKELDMELLVEKFFRDNPTWPPLHIRKKLRDITGFPLERILNLAKMKFKPHLIAAENESQRKRYWEARGLPAPAKMYNVLSREVLNKLKEKLRNHVAKYGSNPSLKMRKMWGKSVPGGVTTGVVSEEYSPSEGSNSKVTNWARRTVWWVPKGAPKPKCKIIKKTKRETSEDRNVNDFIRGDEYDALFESEDEEEDASDVEEPTTSDDTYTPGKIELGGEQRHSSRLLRKAECSMSSPTNNVPESIVDSPATEVNEEIPVRSLRDREARKPLSKISALQLSEQDMLALIKSLRRGNSDHLNTSMRFFKFACEAIVDENLRVFEKPTLKLYSTDVFLPLYQIISTHNAKKPINEHVALIGHALLQHSGSVESAMCFERPGCEKFVYPICRENHFTILFFDKKSGTVTEADSYLTYKISDAEIKSIAAKLEMKTGNIIRLNGGQLRKQTLLNSCGVHIVGYCHLFLSNDFKAPKLKMDIDAPALRNQMKGNLKTNSANFSDIASDVLNSLYLLLSCISTSR